MQKIERLRELNRRRDNGKWRHEKTPSGLESHNRHAVLGHDGGGYFDVTCYRNPDSNCDFIVELANSASALLDIVEAAKYIDDNLGHWFLNPDGPGELKAAMAELTEALQKLEGGE